MEKPREKWANYMCSYIRDTTLGNADDDLKPKKSIESFIGMLSKYKNPDLVPFEKSAWQEASEDKHGNC